MVAVVLLWAALVAAAPVPVASASGASASAGPAAATTAKSAATTATTETAATTETGRGDVDVVEKARARARAERRPLVVIVGLGTCPPCDALEREVVQQPDADAVFRHAVVVHLLEGDAAWPAFAAGTAIFVFPTVVVVDPETGAERDRVEGYTGRAPFVARLGQLLDGTRTAGLEREIAATTDAASLAALLKERGVQRLNRNDRAGIADLDRAALLDFDNDDGIAGFALDRVASWCTAQGDVDGALAHWLLVVHRFPRDIAAGQAAVSAGVLLHQRGDDVVATELVRNALPRLPRKWATVFLLQFADQTGLLVDEAVAAYDSQAGRWPHLAAVAAERARLGTRLPAPTTRQAARPARR